MARHNQVISPSTRPQQQFATTIKLKKSEMGAIKVIKYLFISSLIMLIIGAIVLFAISIDEIIFTSNSIDEIERYVVTEVAAKYLQQFQQQKLSAIFSLIINMLTIILSSLGIIAVIKNHFFLIIVFASLNTLILVISLWSSTARAATILLQTCVSCVAFSYCLVIHLRFKMEIRRRKRLRKEVFAVSAKNGSSKSNSLKKNGVKINGAIVIDDNTSNSVDHHENHNNNGVVVFYDNNVSPNIV